MGFNKKFFTTGGIVASTPSAAAFDPLQNFETVTYTGNGSTQKITGYIRKGAAFNGSSRITSNDPVKNDTTFSISAWINVENINTFNPIISVYGSSAGTRKYLFRVSDSNSLDFFTYDESGVITGIVQESNALTVGTWHHVAATVGSGGDLELYLDGDSVATDTGNSNVNTDATADLIIGSRDDYAAGSSVNNFNGKIDQVRIFNTALNSTKVGQLALEDYTDPKKSTTDYFGDGSGVALYELDEDALSSNFEQAAVFDGSSSNVTLPAGINKNNNFSWSFWVNFDSLTDYDTPIAFQNTYRNYLDILANGTLHFYDGVSLNSPTGTVTTGTWYHVVITKSSSTGRKVYLNNSVVAEDSGTTNSISGGGQNMIGAYNSGSSTALYLDGKIDQVRIYDTALGSTDVEKLYKESADVPTATLVAHYKLDGNAEDVLDTYDGTASNVTYSAGVYGGTPTNVNFLGMAFQPDLVITKSRDSIYSGNHQWYDSVRGAGKVIYSDGTYAEATNPIDGYLGSFDSNGFSLSSGTRNTNDVSNSGENYVAWCWKAGGAEVSGTSSHYTNCEISANPDAGFSIVNFTVPSGTIPTTASYNHGLNAPPKLIITKPYNGYFGASSWYTWAEPITTSNYLLLNTSDTSAAGAIFSSVDSSTVKYRFASNNGGADSDVITYNFTDVVGYQKVGSYTGELAPKFVQTDFAPRFVLIKRTDSSVAFWLIYDSVRGASLQLTPTTDGAEYDWGASPQIQFNSNGFTLTTNNAYLNGVGGQFIYLAIA